MASSANARTFTGKQYRNLWGEIGAGNWLALLVECRTDGYWKLKGTTIEGRCPYPGHSDSSPSFHVKVHKGVAKCYGCQRGTVNPIQFYAEAKGISWSEALLTLRKRFSLKGLGPKITDELQEQERNLEIKTLLADCFQQALCHSIEALMLNPTDPQFMWALPCIDYLKKRKMPTDLGSIKKLPIGILPPLKIMTALLGSKLQTCLPGIEKYMTADYVGSLVFLFHSSPYMVGGFKLRADFLRGDNRKDVVYVKNLDNAPIGLFGLGYYKAFLHGGKPKTDALIVEGEFDALSNMAGQLVDDKAYDVVLATGGAAESHFDALQDYGVARALLVADAPEHGGDILVRAWLTANKIPMKVFTWPEAVKEKDPDDAIKTHGFEAWCQALLEIDPVTGDRKNFQFPHSWAKDSLKEALARIDPDDIRKIKEVCGEIGLCLKDAAEQRSYVAAATLATGLMAADILSLIIGRDDTEEGFVQKILFALKQEYSFVGTEPSKLGGTRVQFWHKEKRQMRSCNVAKPSDMFSTFNVDLGNFIDWVRENVGTPEWTLNKQVGKYSMPMGILEQETLQKKYVEFAIASLLKELPTLENLKELKAGSHYVDCHLAGQDVKRWIVVNGNDVYLGIPTDDAVDWRRLDGPKFGNFSLVLSRQKWSNEIRDTKDLAEGCTMDIGAAYNFLVEALNLGWKFRNQQEDAEYLAAAMMLNTVCSALPRQLYTVLNGTRGSGKSSFLALLTSSHPEMRLLEASFGMDSYTVAGFRKEMNNCSLGAVLDEFEDLGGDGHSKHVRGILRDVRGLTSNPECRILRGNMESHEATAYTLRCQIWAAAIQYLRDEADVSRFVQVHTECVEGHPAPRIVLGQRYSEEDFSRIRRTLTLGMFRHVPKLLQAIQRLRERFASAEAMRELSQYARTEVPSRYLDGVIIPAALMELCGKDPMDFIHRFVKAKSADLKRVVHMTHTQTLLDHIFSAQIEFKKPDADVRFTTVRTLLSHPGERTLLNNTESGVHYIEFNPLEGDTRITNRWLVIVWSDALQGVLKSVTTYKFETPSRLKQLAESDSSRTIPSKRLNEVPGGLKRYVKFGVSASDLTVYDLTDTINEWDNPSTGI